LKKRPAFALEAVDRPLPSLPPMQRRVSVGARQVALRSQLLLIAEDTVDLGQRGVALRSNLGGTAGDDDRRLGMVSTGAADSLARLALGLGGDGAGVDNDRVGKAGRRCGMTDDLRLEHVQPAAEC